MEIIDIPISTFKKVIGDYILKKYSPISHKEEKGNTEKVNSVVEEDMDVKEFDIKETYETTCTNFNGIEYGDDTTNEEFEDIEYDDDSDEDFEDIEGFENIFGIPHKLKTNVKPVVEQPIKEKIHRQPIKTVKMISVDPVVDINKKENIIKENKVMPDVKLVKEVYKEKAEPNNISQEVNIIKGADTPIEDWVSKNGGEVKLKEALQIYTLKEINKAVDDFLVIRYYNVKMGEDYLCT